ncbi:MAG: LamG domain-containing protein [Bacteroidota bacterium]
MKKIVKFSIAIIVFISCALFISCDEEQPISEGEAVFSFEIRNLSGGRTTDDFAPQKVVFSVNDEDGNPYIIDEEVPLTFLNSSYATTPVSFPVGDYSLEKFLVIGNDSIVYYATPYTDSKLAYLVEEPLPISFEISSDKVTQIIPEVISTEEGDVQDFGFGEFPFEIVQTFDVLISVFTYSNSSKSHQLSESQLTIYSNTDSIGRIPLFATINKFTLSEKYNSYQLLIEKEGFLSFNYTYSLDSIKSFQGDNRNGPLKVFLIREGLTDGLVAHYPFNGGANDESGKGNNGQVSGASLVADRNGEPLSAYDFDGINDFIEIDNTLQEIATSSEGTFSFWLKPSTNLPAGLNFILAFGDTDANRWIGAYYHTNPNDGIGRFRFAARNLKTDFLVETTKNFLSPEEWINITCVQDGAGPFIYVNGDLVEQRLVDGEFDDISVWFRDYPQLDNGRIGFVDQNNLKQWYLDGALDEIRLYDRALSKEEVKILSEL